MKRILTTLISAAAVLASSATVLWQGEVKTGEWGSSEGVSCVKVGKASFATAAAGDKLTVTVSETGENAKLLYKDGSSWADLVDAPAVDLTAPTQCSLTIESNSLEVLKANGLILQGCNITITEVALESSSKYEMHTVWTGNQEITWNGESAPRVTDNLCAELKAGDVIALTIGSIGSKNDWPKCCFRSVKDDSDITTLELWDFIGETMPTTKMIEIEDPEVWKYGFYIVGCANTVTGIELGFKNSSPAPSDETVLWEGDPTALSWGAGPTVSATKAAKINVGDELAITVTAVAEASVEEWPKIVCRCEDGWDEIFTVEMWDDRDAEMPLVKTVKVTEEMMALIAKGFNFGGTGVTIEKVALKTSQGGGEEPAGVVLWEGNPVSLGWGDNGVSVSASKAEQIKVGGTLLVTVEAVAEASVEEWPKIVCRCEDGWDEIFTIEMWDDRDAEMPLVKSVTVTEEMLPMLAKGFNFGGTGCTISKVVYDTTSSIGGIVVPQEPEFVNVYTITGVCVRKNVRVNEAVDNLPAGFYIVGGKKVFVR